MQPFLDAGGDNASLALSVRPLFGEIALTHPQFVDAVQTALGQLRKNRVRATLEQILKKT
jgi:hypothetical protein